MRGSAWTTLVGAVLALAGCGKDQSPPQPAKAVIAEAAVPVSNLSSPLYAAVIKARIDAVQSFRVGGRIEARAVDVGDYVRKGQVLATLDATDWDLNSEALRGQLAAATAQRDNARADLERYRELTAQKLMSESELDRQQHAVATAEGQVAALAAQAQEAAKRLGYTQLRADAAGVVTRVMAEAGQVVSEGAPVLVVARAADLEVDFSVPEHRRSDVQVGATIQLSLWSQPETTISARVRTISPAADPVTRTFQVRATLLKPPASVQIGMTASVRLGVGDPPSAAVSLPIAAVFEQEGAKSVWIVDAAGGTLHRAVVQIEGVSSNRYLVTSGVRPGDFVVTAGVHRLTAGDRVTIYAGGEHPARSDER